MWIRRTKWAAVIVLVTLAVAATVLVLLWRDRPELFSDAWEAPVPASTVAADNVTVTWLGVTTLLFDDGETQILIDGFFSRPSLEDIILDLPVANDAAMVNFALNKFGMRRLAAIIPTHSHFDHAMDVGSIANRSSASILGSASTIAFARGAGVPEDQLTLASDGERYTFGRFDITLLPSTHAPIGWRASVPFAGHIEAPLKMPQPVSAFKEGGSYTIVVAHPRGTAVVQGSAGLPDKALEDVPADVVFLGVGGLETLGDNYVGQYWQTLVTATGAQSIYPIHFDDFTRPFGEIVAAPRFLGDLEETARLFTALRDRWDTDAKLVLPVFGVPIAIYWEPLPDT
jgi:L-ascorbate metabolism protein UlaG (beta-lactamase superfamily)